VNVSTDDGNLKFNLPKHVAIIMDGNGRWAEHRRRNRTFGHLRGARIAREIIEAASKRGLKELTLYTFSSENWLRPLEEVSFLMALLSRHLKRERATLIKHKIRFQAIGELDRLPASVRAEVDETIRATASCTGMKLTFALSYGGRQEILNAAKSMAVDAAKGIFDPSNITDEQLAQRFQAGLLTKGMTDPDLVIRTSGETRLSNFFLWQCAYSEIYFTQTLWPDYSEAELEQALQWYGTRERRYGRTSAQIACGSPTAATGLNGELTVL
jgi:undecaprenyl diphosphate synthase